MKFEKVFLMVVCVGLLCGLVACGSGQPTQAPVKDTPATAVPAGEEKENSGGATSGAAASGEFGDPAGALDSADSYSLSINAAGNKTTFEIIKSKKQYHIITGMEGAEQEMYVIEDKLYTLTQGMCVGVDVGDQMDSLAQLGDITMYTMGIAGEELVGTEEVNGVKADHYRTGNADASVDVWVAQEGNYLVRLVTEGQGQKVEIDISNINALSALELPEACSGGMNVGGIEIPVAP